MAQQQDINRYHKIKNIFFFVSLCLDAVVLILMFSSGFSSMMKNWAVAVSLDVFLYRAIYVFIFTMIFYVIHFPVQFFLGFIWEHRFNLSNQKPQEWFWDDVKQAMIGLAMMLIGVETSYCLLGFFSSTWWLWVGIFWILFSIVIARITPTLLIPLFYKYLPVPSESLKTKISNLFSKCHVPLKDVSMIDMSAKTKKANAFLCGIGKSRRVVLSDTLIQNFTEDEIEAVVAHELGHYKHHDITKLLCVNSVIMIGGLYLISLWLQHAVTQFGLSGIDDISFFPLILLAFMIFGLVTIIPLNGFSRWIEHHADEFSLQMTDDQGPFISMMEKLGKMNMAKMEPAFWEKILLYDHPPLKERIDFARLFKKQ